MVSERPTNEKVLPYPYLDERGHGLVDAVSFLSLFARVHCEHAGIRVFIAFAAVARCPDCPAGARSRHSWLFSCRDILGGRINDAGEFRFTDPHLRQQAFRLGSRSVYCAFIGIGYRAICSNIRVQPFRPDRFDGARDGPHGTQLP